MFSSDQIIDYDMARQSGTTSVMLALYKTTGVTTELSHRATLC